MNEWIGSFSVNLVLRRRVDGLLFIVSNIYGPTIASLKSAFFQEIRSIVSQSVGLWTILGDFNVLLSLRDKNGSPSNLNDILNFRNVVTDIGLIDLPISNKSFTLSNGRRFPTLERLNRAFVSKDWHLFFPRSTLRALPRPRFDHTPLVLTAYSFVPSHLFLGSSPFGFDTRRSLRWFLRCGMLALVGAVS